ncbi:hypothetical protein [Nocardioides sp. SLBN-35]|uniref:hypothetical protein n=1 Tax=Nocardioides sp. SLBN-35 TaxID=2768445 RepID=UPI00116CBC4B|nr:hypothetical protein [Nocardioides sp. SLBN-35]TQK71294.1 hypothetical protein FBY23_3084 [Nocardioides sp. SLBN-35]
MAALVDRVVAGTGSHPWPQAGPAGEHPWQEDGADIALDDEADEAVPLALALIPAKGVE